MANGDIAGGGDEVWEQAISELEKRFTFGRCEVGKGKFCGREVVQAADGSMRVGQPVFVKSLDFVPLGKMRKEQSGDANETEKVARRSVLGALGHLARESRPDLSGLVSIPQKSSQQGPEVRHTRNQLGGETGQRSHRSCIAYLQDSCGANFVWCLTVMPVVEAYMQNKRKRGT